MPCNNLLKGWRSKYQSETTGKYPVVFSGSEANLKLSISVPCGKCKGCLKERSTAWGVRCVNEARLQDENSFLTLTYHPKHLPKDGMLNKEHFQLFLKRYRKLIAPTKIRYLHCGEYGDTSYRAHYHALIFGHEFTDKIFYKNTKSGNNLYTSKTLHDLWGMGLCIIGDVTFASAQYVAKYINKPQQLNKLKNNPLYKPPYNTSSRRPGIGIPWLEKNYTDVYNNDYIIVQGGKYKIPRAYDKWLETNHLTTYKDIKHSRRKLFDKKALDQAALDLQGIAAEQILTGQQGKRDVS